MGTACILQKPMGFDTFCGRACASPMLSRGAPVCKHVKTHQFFHDRGSFHGKNRAFKMRCKSENIGSSANSTEFSKTRLSFLRGPRCGPRAKMMILLMIFIGAMLEPSSPILKLLGTKMRCKSENVGSSANSPEFSKTRLSFLRGPRCGPRAKMMILLRFLNDF